MFKNKPKKNMFVCMLRVLSALTIGLVASASGQVTEGSAPYNEGTNVSVSGRVGQNSDINGEYKFQGVVDGRPFYVKEALNQNQTALYLFAIATDSETIWAIGEEFMSPANVRSFVVDQAGDPLSVAPNSVWRVFEEDSFGAMHDVHDLDMYIAEVSCFNAVQDGGETGVDCGGECRRCEYFRECRIDSIPDSFTHGTCPIDGTLAHGEACEYRCPLSYVAGGRELVKCYDGVTERQSSNTLCQIVFSTTACPFLKLAVKADQGQAVCNGLYVAYGSKDDFGKQQSLLWFSEGTNGGKKYLFWHKGVWTCTTTAMNETLGVLPDTQPGALVLEKGDSQSVSSGTWKMMDGSVEQLPTTLSCVRPGDGLCKYIRTFEWPMVGPFTLNGLWYLFDQKINDRPAYTLDAPTNKQLLYLYWTTRGYWLVDTDMDDARFLAYQFSVDNIPTSGTWRFWDSSTWISQDVELWCIKPGGRMVLSDLSYLNGVPSVPVNTALADFTGVNDVQ